MPSKRKSISLAPAWLTTTGSARNWSAWVRASHSSNLPPQSAGWKRNMPILKIRPQVWRRRTSSSKRRRIRSKETHGSPWPFAESAAEAQRLRPSAETGHGLERAILESSAFALLLAGEATDPSREDLLDRVRTARALCEEHRRTLTNEHETIAGELAFLDAEGVSSVPGDVNLVVQALRDAGIAHAVPAEHYLAQYRPDADKDLRVPAK